MPIVTKYDFLTKKIIYVYVMKFGQTFENSTGYLKKRLQIKNGHNLLPDSHDKKITKITVFNISYKLIIRNSK